jgi:hypothetical protein
MKSSLFLMSLYYIMSIRNSLGVDGFPFPVGTILPYAGNAGNLPDCWEFCDGTPRLKADYGELYGWLKDAYNFGLVSEDSFLLPNLGTSDTYLYPSDTLETDAGEPKKATVETADGDEILIPLSAIPNFTTGNFTTTNPTKQDGVARITLAGRGDEPTGNYYACGDCGADPNIVKLNASSEDGGTFTLNSVDYLFKNKKLNTADPPVLVSAQLPIKDLTTDSLHAIEYGGWVCAHIIKVSSFLDDPNGVERKAFYNNNRLAIEQEAGYVARDAARLVEITQDDLRRDQEAAAEAAALDAEGQGGGTNVPYAARPGAPASDGGDVPNLAGFILPANPTYP